MCVARISHATIEIPTLFVYQQMAANRSNSSNRGSNKKALFLVLPAIRLPKMPLMMMSLLMMIGWAEAAERHTRHHQGANGTVHIPTEAQQ